MRSNDQYIYVLRPTRIEMLVDGGTEEEQAHVADHFSYLKGLTERGTAILMGRTQETVEETIGIVIFKASSQEEARDFMEEDPAVKNGVMGAKIFRFKIALFNPEGVDA